MQVTIINEEQLQNNEEFSFLIPLIEALRNNTEQSIYFPDVEGKCEASAKVEWVFNDDYKPMGVFKFVCEELKVRMNYMVQITANKNTQPESLNLKVLKISGPKTNSDHSVNLERRTHAVAIKEMVQRFGRGGEFRKIVKM